MIKISRYEAYQSFDENDFSVMDDETYLCFHTDQRKGREQTEQFYMNESLIMLVIYWDDVKVHEVSFENRIGLSVNGKERLKKGKQVEEKTKVIGGLQKEGFQLNGAFEEVNEEMEITESRKTYLQEKKEQLIRNNEVHRYFKRTVSLMLYTNFLCEEGAEKLLSVLEKNYKQKNNQLLKELEVDEFYWIFYNNDKNKFNKAIKKENEFFQGEESPFSGN